MVGKEALLLKKEPFENLSEEHQTTPNGVGFNGDISEVRKQIGVIESENKQENATFDRLVYDTHLPSSESIFFVH